MTCINWIFIGFYFEHVGQSTDSERANLKKRWATPIKISYFLYEQCVKNRWNLFRTEWDVFFWTGIKFHRLHYYTASRCRMIFFYTRRSLRNYGPDTLLLEGVIEKLNFSTRCTKVYFIYYNKFHSGQRVRKVDPCWDGGTPKDPVFYSLMKKL